MRFGTTAHYTEGILDYVYTDICGPTKMASIGGNHYFMSFIYDYSRPCWVYTMSTKGKFCSYLWSGRKIWRRTREKDQGTTSRQRRIVHKRYFPTHKKSPPYCLFGPRRQDYIYFHEIKMLCSHTFVQFTLYADC